jgi:chromosome segregation ATPase
MDVVPAASSGNVSPRASSEAGEDMMQDFVKLHMMSILQPFADRVHELQTMVQQLAVDLGHLRNTSDRQQGVSDQLTQKLSVVRSDADDMNERLEKLETEVTSAKREWHRIEGNHEITKATLGKTKESLETVSSSVGVLQSSLQGASDRISGVECMVTNTEKKIADEMELRLNKQGRACKDLVERQAEVMKACEQAKTLGQQANAA